ncbi:MAG: transglycosylase SLT domain-containing protein [Acidobacteria bacterium]|nr:transglycosylase SLT domain-containing protein [Acidobacteriota bacterium]
MNRRTWILTTAGILIPIILIVALFVAYRRGRIGGDVLTGIADAVGVEREPRLFEAPPEEWTKLISAMTRGDAWADLAYELEWLAANDPTAYEKHELRYLHARALTAAEEWDEALDLLDPEIEEGDYPQLALYHAARALDGTGDEENASRYRRRLIEGHAGSIYAIPAVQEELAYLVEHADPSAALSWVRSLPSAIPESTRRESEAMAIVALFEEDRSTAIGAGLALLARRHTDDAAERILELFERENVAASLNAEQRYLIARTASSHRHFGHAIELLRPLRQAIPGRLDDINFALGRAHFFNEDFASAEEAYRYAARVARSRAWQSRFFYHASRAAQLQGNDDVAESLMADSIRVRGSYDSTAASLAQRMRTRAKGGRWSDARADLEYLRKIFPRGETIIDASLAYGVACVAAGRNTEALEVLGRIDRRRLDPYERAEILYWRGRALESENPLGALDEYLDVLRMPVATHYKHFIYERFEVPEIREQVDAAIERRRTALTTAREDGLLGDARDIQREIVLLSDHSVPELLRLGQIYALFPQYSAVLRATPAELPSLPLEGGSKGERLIAMGLYDEAASYVDDLYPLNSLESALTRAIVDRLGGRTRPSVRAAEILMNRVPDDFSPHLLPIEIRKLLYPDYFSDLIWQESQEHGADPRLLISIMREESRFDPNAKSPAAARGLLQFIFLTARQIGEKLGLEGLRSEDLYEPETIIRLGARYVGDLMKEFDGNRYKAAAAYNAGPAQSKLWSRLAPGDGDDYFLATIYFDETKHYVRKVLNSYQRYAEIYGDSLFADARENPEQDLQ